MGGKSLYSLLLVSMSSHPRLYFPTHPPLLPTLPQDGSAFLPKPPIHLAGDAFGEEANKRFERYPGQTSNQII